MREPCTEVLRWISPPQRCMREPDVLLVPRGLTPIIFHLYKYVVLEIDSSRWSLREGTRTTKMPVLDPGCSESKKTNFTAVHSSSKCRVNTPFLTPFRPTRESHQPNHKKTGTNIHTLVGVLTEMKTMSARLISASMSVEKKRFRPRLSFTTSSRPGS